MKLHPVSGKRSIRLGDADARWHGAGTHAKSLEKATEKQAARISELQRVLYADARFAVLIILQGRDASGKDGTIRRVFSAVNPQGCTVTSFKVPTEIERRHDFLWRVHQAVPARGMIGIFNRSQYEDILLPTVHDEMGKKAVAERCEAVNDFEHMLDANGVVILKFMLHISRDEQRERLQARVDDPTKHWKFQEGDLEDRTRWDAFTKAYRTVLARTSTDWAPWYVVPADDKDVRDALISRAIADALAGLRLRYPKGDPAMKGLEIV